MSETVSLIQDAKGILGRIQAGLQAEGLLDAAEWVGSAMCDLDEALGAIEDEREGGGG